ncbi:MAG TPA: DPP IV N-terminal domain-containing protein, partial [Thermoanaerobaculia bacterium]|nr:DPP IV N-terminal domain-containing protein [Thermoanaerobaculia bacterium]
AQLDRGTVFLDAAAPDASGVRPTEISWSPDGGRLAYLWDDTGDTGQALWTMDPATGERQAVLRASELGKDVEVDEYVWAPKGDALVLIAGGDLYAYSLGDRNLRRLTRTPDEETDPKFSPDGRRIAYVRDYDLHVMDLATGRERALTTDGQQDTFINGATDWVYWEEIWGRDSTGFWWSPDGTKIAYYRFDERPVGTYPIADLVPLDPTVAFQKYPRPGEPNPVVRVGVMDLDGGKTTWMKTGEEDSYLARVAWSPEGDVAIQKLSRDQARLELLRCDAADGACAPLVTETSATWINLGLGFEYLPDGRFLWGSEESGWNRLYLHDQDGKRVRAVTPDGWSVTSLDAVTPDGWVVFGGFRTSTLGATERHVLRARLSEDRTEELTRDPGSHVAVVAPDGKSWVHTWSTAETLPRVELRRASGDPVALPFTAPSGYDPATLPKWEFLTIPGPDGLQLPARILKPANFDPSRRYPALIYHYGGPGSQVVLNWWDTRGRDLFHKRMAQRGFVVANVDNPASIFFGKAGEEKVHRRFGEENLPAQLALVDYLKKTGYVDGGRIGLWGWSGGGIHTLYCILNRPGVWKAAMAGAPVTDWRLYDSIWTERYLGTPQNNPEGFRLSSPIHLAENLKDQLLLVHGLADDNVHPQNTVMLTDRLVKAGIPFELAYYPGQKHGFQGASQGHFFARLAEFFTRTLIGVEVEDVEVRVEGR